ncbi:MAG: SDR family oxidoreductase [Bacteroidetes bacterium]|nr:SDR family oxidoreductase [Bacteroidota bacterium]MBL6963794.1 SDR family oxidoreductase [Bacteroidota bacterium]
MSNYFTNKIVWVTGASSGIGEGIAYSLANEKANLIISAPDMENLEQVRDKCMNKGARCQAVFLDLGDKESINKAFDLLRNEYTKIDVLINNGGISQRTLALETNDQLIRKIMEVNYFGTIDLTLKVLDLMVKNGGGQLAVTSSISGKFGFPLRSIYASSKHALHGFFETIRLEHLKDHIDVTIVCPGRVRTNISLNALTKDGSSYGKMDPGQAAGVSVEYCAAKYLKAIRRKKKEVLIGGKELIPVYLKRFIPSLFYILISRIKPN